MSFVDWIGEPVNWTFTAIGLGVLFSGFRVVTAKNVVHAALFLVGALAGTAALFLLLSAEFVAWVLVLVYIGAVIVLFLFGIMITRAPTGPSAEIDHRRKAPAALAAFLTFVVTAGSSVSAFGAQALTDVGGGTSTELLGEELLSRFVIPFEVVSFVLLGALIGGITLARKDLSPAEEELAEEKE